MLPVSAWRPPAFHVMTKPRGAICNLDCQYCYFLSKERLFPDSSFRMSESLLEEYTRQYIEAQSVDHVTFAWQGGEPTLMGLEFFAQAVSYQEKYRKPGMTIENTLQTNGVALDDSWGAFLAEHNFLVGISIDGPRALHDHFRVDKGGAPTFDRVLRGLNCLKRHGVAFNILTTVHAANVEHPLEVYRFFRDELGAAFMQFIPIVERENATGFQEGSTVTPRSVNAEGYGSFLVTIFDEWVRHDVGRVYVQLFDIALGAWLGMEPALCIFAETCGTALALEHNGDLFSCDHFVEPKHRLGNIIDVPLTALVESRQQYDFGQAKREALPAVCRACPVKFACNGGCPKDRFIQAPDGEPGLNYLCAGYKHFFTHIDRAMQIMAAELRAGRAPANVMLMLAREDAARAAALEDAYRHVGRNDACPCGSGLKYKKCCGRKQPSISP